MQTNVLFTLTLTGPEIALLGEVARGSDTYGALVDFSHQTMDTRTHLVTLEVPESVAREVVNLDMPEAIAASTIAEKLCDLADDIAKWDAR